MEVKPGTRYRLKGGTDLQKQTTLAKTAVYKGIGLHSGREVSIELMPAEPDSGIVFLRTDLEGNPEIKASAENVTSTKCSSKTVMEVKKAEGIFAAMFEVGKKETEIEFDSVEGLFGSVGAAFNDKYEYVINGKKLTVSKKTSVKDYLAEYDVATNENTKLSGKGVVETYHFNEEGLLVDSTVSVDVSFSASSMGITVSGAINMYTSVTNTYSK